MTKKNTAKDFGKMVAEFGSNWKKITDAKKKNKEALEKAMKGNY